MTIPERDIQAEQDHAEFTGWAEAQGYGDERYDFEEMEFAFTSGMEAERDPAAVAAHVANPDAADYDSAAEITRLRGVADRYRFALVQIAAGAEIAPDGSRAGLGRIADRALKADAPAEPQPASAQAAPGRQGDRRSARARRHAPRHPRPGRPGPAGRRAVSGQTPGQAAYEAYAMAAPDDLEFAEWDELPDWQQRAIDAAAQAGYEHHAGPKPAPDLGTAWRLLDETRARHDALRERVARAAAKLDADALVTAPSKKSEIQREAAARLRETLGDA